MNKCTVDLTNRRFGKLFVKRFAGYFLKSGRNRPFWICVCDCSPTNEKIIRATNLLNNSTQSCGCIKRGKSNKCWKGYGDISKKRFSRIKYNALKRNLKFLISIEYIWELFLKQNKKCVYTNLELKFALTERDDKDETTASLDRIDSSKGYIEGNVQWIHKVIQPMKMDKTEEEFKYWIKLIYENTY